MKLILVAALFCFATASFSQQLYVPRDIAKAYEKGTRSLDGNPGKNYWQNRGRYKITMDVMPPDRNIKGYETITYYNNSPDTLRTPSIKLFLNIHKPGATRSGGASPDYLNDGVTIDEFKINGKDAKIRKDPLVFTNVAVRLPQPLLPHDSIQFTFKWHYEISLESNREGMIDSTTYFLAYFYPRVAVYDDYNGWDRMDFNDTHEFYSDFNDYDVTINTPANYIVWGTGTLHQPEKLLQQPFLNRYNESLSSDKVINIVTQADLLTKKVTTPNAVNNWQFTSGNIPDVAFGISDHYVWDGCSVVVDDATQRRASAQAAYNDTAADYHHVSRFAQHSLNWLSHNWPGVPYPYEKTTVFQGYAGMEYPMMANDETYADTSISKFVAEHEIAHTYMPFYMGINETRYGMMDEGWATTFELFIGRYDRGKKEADEFYKRFRINGWAYHNSADEDIPIITPANSLVGPGFGNNEYGKASIGYFAVMDILGEHMFKKCLHEFMARWNGKHPTPWDMFYTFNNVSGKDLNWFWNNWFFTSGYIDFIVKDVKQTSKGVTITVSNKGGFVAPADIQLTYTDGSTETKHLSPEIWKTNMKQATITVGSKKKIQSVKLDTGIFVDTDDSNNIWEKK